MSTPIKILGVIIGEANSVKDNAYTHVSLNYIGKNLLGEDNLANVSLFTQTDPLKLPHLQFLTDIGEVLILVPEKPLNDDEDDPEPLRIQWRPHWKTLFSHLPT